MAVETKTGTAAPETGWSAESAVDGKFTDSFLEGVFKARGAKMPAAEKTAATQEVTTDETEKKEPAAGVTEAEASTKTAKEGEGEQPVKTPEELEQEAAAAAAGETTTDETAEKTAAIVGARLKDLPEAQRKIAQTIINERIGEITAKAKAEANRLGSRVEELTTELDAARKKVGAPASATGIHPALLLESAAEIDQYADALDAQEASLDQFVDTGIEADEAKDTPGFTPEQVRARLRQIQRERDRIIPQARTLVQQRAESVTAVKASYPELFDPKTEEYRIADSLRKLLPELRRLPDADAMIAKFVLGTKAFAGSKKTLPVNKAAATSAATEKTKKQTATTRKAPRVAGDGAAALGSVLDDPSHQQPDASGAINNHLQDRSRANLSKVVGALLFKN